MDSFMQLVKDVFKCDESFVSEIQSREDIESCVLAHPLCYLGQSLLLGKNGVGDRFARGKFMYVVFYGTGQHRVYSGLSDRIDERDIRCIVPYALESTKRIQYIQLLGLRETADQYNNRHIPKEIKAYFKDARCIICGTSAEVIPDHKDGLYRDKAVTVEEFQPLCMHHNFVKRQRFVEFKKNKNLDILSMRTIPFLKPLLEIVPEFKEHEIECTFWYDPVMCMKQLAYGLKTDSLPE